MMTTDKLSKRSYREITEIVTAVINKWDPYDLISAGAPDNEFAQEVLQIAAKIHEIDSPTELAEVIFNVFSKSFGPDFFSVTECMQVADELFTKLQTLGLLEKRNHEAQPEH